MDRHRRPERPRARVVTLALVVAMALAAACSPVAPASSSPPAATPSGGPASGGPASGGPIGSSPATSPAAGSDGAAPTYWPVAVQDGIIALGAMQSDLGRAVNDLSAAVDAENVPRMRTVALDLAAFIGGNLVSAEALKSGSFPELGSALVEAMTEIRDGSQAIAAGIDANDSAAIEAAFGRISEGMRKYAAVQPRIGELVPEALRQRGALLQ